VKFGTLADVFSPTPKRILADDIVVRLREAISDGRLTSGARLSEELLAGMMGVSRGPIREALNQLEREGLVIKQRNKGSFVARLSREDLDEVYSLRLALEKLAIQQAIRMIEPKQLADLQAVVDAMAVNVNGRTTTAHKIAELDLGFHDILYQASQHKRLCSCWATLRPQIHIFLLTRNVASSDFGLYAVQSHQTIVDVIRARDEARAITTIENHLQAAYERIVESYSQAGVHGHEHNPAAEKPI
jgi:DNA-binding GntR family transcriptional regulator